MAFTGLLRYNYIRNETAAQAGDGNAFCIRRNGTCLIWVNKDEQLCVVISCIGHIVRGGGFRCIFFCHSPHHRSAVFERSMAEFLHIFEV